MEAFSLMTPTDIDGALAAASGPDAKFIAGGTDLIQLMKDWVERPRRLIDIDGLSFDRIELSEQGVRIGALARMSEVADHAELRRRYPVIAEALLASASPQLRNMATIGGNLLQRTRCGYFRDVGFPCNKRVPGSGCPAINGDNRLLAILGGSDHCAATNASDLAVALAALDAAVELRSASSGTRSVPVTEFHLVPGDTPDRETAMQLGEIVTAVLVPPPAAGQRSHYLKIRDRASFEFALVSVAVVVTLDGGEIRSARVAMGGVDTKPWRLPVVEAALAGAPARPASIAAANAISPAPRRSAGPAV